LTFSVFIARRSSMYLHAVVALRIELILVPRPRTVTRGLTLVSMKRTLVFPVASRRSATRVWRQSFSVWSW
jgi:hypothetical protein